MGLCRSAVLLYGVSSARAFLPTGTRITAVPPCKVVSGLGRPVPPCILSIRRGTSATVSMSEAAAVGEEAAAVGQEPAAPAAPVGQLTELSRLEIRTGRILEVSRHPDAESLYVEKIDVGGEEPRTIVSGLVKFCTEDQLRGRDVVVLCNLKPVNMRGVLSAGMLLCSSNEDHTEVEPLSPPPGTPTGELVTFEGHQAAPVEPGNRAGKAWKKVADKLKVNADKVASYTAEDLPAPFMTSKGAITSSLAGGIS